jgi:hypothetical protein
MLVKVYFLPQFFFEFLVECFIIYIIDILTKPVKWNSSIINVRTSIGRWNSMENFHGIEMERTCPLTWKFFMESNVKAQQ